MKLISKNKKAAANKAGSHSPLSLCVPRGARMEGDVTHTQGLDVILNTVLTEVFANTPEIGLIGTNFSDESLDKGASVISRVYKTMEVTEFGAEGVSPQYKDVKVTLNGFKQIYFEFAANIIECTSIDLIKDTFSPMIEGLKKYIFDKISALFTESNYPNKIEISPETSAWRTFALSASSLTKNGMSGAKFAALSTPEWLDVFDDRNIIKYVSTVTNGPTPFKGDLSLAAPCNHIAFEDFSMDSSKLLGFSGTKAAVLYVARPPKDVRQYLPTAVDGGMGWQMISVDLGAGSKFTGLLNYGINKDLKAWMRLAWLDGVAVGWADAGVRWVPGTAAIVEE